MDVDEVRLIGRRLRRLRENRGKSLRVIAGLAGITTLLPGARRDAAGMELRGMAYRLGLPE